MRTAKAQISLCIRSLINVFVIRCLDSIIPLVSICEISSPYLASVAAQAGLNLPWSQTPKTGFLVTRLSYGYLGLDRIFYTEEAKIHFSVASCINILVMLRLEAKPLI